MSQNNTGEDWESEIIALNQSSNREPEIDSIIVDGPVEGQGMVIARPTEGCMRIERIRLSGHTLVIGLVLFIAGCQGSQAGAQRWGGGVYGQGNEERQKYRAASFDPYPLNDIGPEVVGGRPRGFMNPLPEANRNQIQSKATRRQSMGGW